MTHPWRSIEDRRGEDLDTQQTQGVVAVYLTPAADGVQASISLECLGGPKRYMRIWLEARTIEWGWVLHPTAVLLWRMR